MPTSLVDLDAYFQRIGYSQNRSPTLATLQRLCAAHTEAIAFEALSPFLGESVKLDLASLQDKLIRRGRGGFCYEQNMLLWHVLEQMGFQVSGLSARVRWNVPENIVIARSHMLLLINLDSSEYIVDVGFGGMTPTGPLRLKPNVEQATPHEPFRLIYSAGSYTLEAKLAGSWKALYSFDLQEQYLPDYTVLSWYHSTYPESPFVKNLIAARPASNCRHALLNNKYTVHHLNGETKKQLLNNADELLEVLQTIFGLRLSSVFDMRSKFAQLVEWGHAT